jgi:hypothetical protein
MRLAPPIDFAISAAIPNSTQPIEPNMVALIPHFPSSVQQLGNKSPAMPPIMMSTEGQRGSPVACAVAHGPPALAVPQVLVNGSRQHAVRSPAGSGGMHTVEPHVSPLASLLSAARPEAPPLAGFPASSPPQPAPIALIVTITVHIGRCLLMLAPQLQRAMPSCAMNYQTSRK